MAGGLCQHPADGNGRGFFAHCAAVDVHGHGKGIALSGGRPGACIRCDLPLHFRRVSLTHLQGSSFRIWLPAQCSMLQPPAFALHAFDMYQAKSLHTALSVTFYCPVAQKCIEPIKQVGQLSLMSFLQQIVRNTRGVLSTRMLCSALGV